MQNSLPTASWLQENYDTAKGETALWVAVIMQAVTDARSKCKKAESKFFKNEAINWLTGNSKDFVDVCLCAGLNPDYVRSRAKKAIISATAWRAEAGKGKRYEERKKYRAKLREIKQEAAKIIDFPKK